MRAMRTAQIRSYKLTTRATTLPAGILSSQIELLFRVLQLPLSPRAYRARSESRSLDMPGARKSARLAFRASWSSGL
jgi:hypothetical protein